MSLKHDDDFLMPLLFFPAFGFRRKATPSFSVSAGIKGAVRSHKKISFEYIFMPEIAMLYLLFALSSLELGLFPELAVFVFAHFLFTPLLYVSHSFTSSIKK